MRTKEYLIKKNEEAYANVFTVHYPDEERPAGRPLKTAPCYERLKNMGAVFGSSYGWKELIGLLQMALKQLMTGLFEDLITMFMLEMKQKMYLIM